MSQRRVVVGVVAAVLVLGAGALLARDALAAADHLEAARGHLVAVQDAAVDGDAGGAEAAVLSAREELDAGAERTDGPLWAIAGIVPRYGATARAVPDAVALGQASVDVTEAAINSLLPVLADGAGSLLAADGAVDLAALADLADGLAALPVDDLLAARDRLAALPAAGLLGPAGDARDDAVAEADRVLTTIRRGRAGAEAMQGFLGGDGPRTYLLGVQNPAELRGTGGLIGYVVELTVDDGRLGVRTGVTDDDFLPDRIAAPGQQTFGFVDEEPVARSAEFADRYDHVAGGAIVQSVNLDPDLPTVGPVLTELYRDRTGREVDGVVLVDPFTLAAVVRATGGPLDLPPELVADVPLDARLGGREIPQVLLVDVYDAFGSDDIQARRRYNEAVTAAALERITGGGWNATALARSLTDAAAERRLQLYATDADEQAAFAALGLVGELPTEVVDVLAVAGSNAGPDKSDAHVAHQLTADITLRRIDDTTLSRSATVTVTVDNPLRPQDHDDYITGTNTVTGVGNTAGERLRDARNRTWFTIWVPGDSALTALRDGVGGNVLRTGEIHGHTAIDHVLETPSAATAAFSAPYEGPVELVQDGGRLRYDLVLWRQAKAIPDQWDLTVQPPAGMEVTRVEVEGGGPPATGLGVTDGEPVTAALEDGVVRLQGAVTRDTVLRIWLAD